MKAKVESKALEAELTPLDEAVPSSFHECLLLFVINKTDPKHFGVRTDM